MEKKSIDGATVWYNAETPTNVKKKTFECI